MYKYLFVLAVPYSTLEPEIEVDRSPSQWYTTSLMTGVPSKTETTTTREVCPQTSHIIISMVAPAAPKVRKIWIRLCISKVELYDVANAWEWKCNAKVKEDRGLWFLAKQKNVVQKHIWCRNKTTSKETQNFNKLTVAENLKPAERKESWLSRTRAFAYHLKFEIVHKRKAIHGLFESNRENLGFPFFNSTWQCSA